MKGLVLKDISSLVTELKYIAVLLISMIFLQNEWIYMFAIVYAAVLPISALGYDERKWSKCFRLLLRSWSEVNIFWVIFQRERRFCLQYSARGLA